MKSFRAIAYPLGVLLLIFSAAFLPPLAVSLINGDGLAWNFAAAIGLDLALAGMLIAPFRRRRRQLKVREGFPLLCCLWTLLPAVAAVPILLSIPALSITIAYFEAVSGLSTSGATTLSGLDELPRALNLWRHELQWIGGFMGLMMVSTVLPWMGLGELRLARTERGELFDETRLASALARTMLPMSATYAVLTLACALLLKAAGMSGFDAICHAFSTISLGGFSTHDANIAYFHSAAIEAVLAAFMLISGINFATHYAAWRSRGLGPYRRDIELVPYLSLILFSAIGLTLCVWVRSGDASLAGDFRHVGFELVSFATDSGFSAYDYRQWPLFVPLWMLLLSCICVSAGSPGGGLRMIRTLILFRQSGREMNGLLHPSSVRALKIGQRAIDERAVSSVLSFVHLYTMSIVGLGLLLILSGMNLLDAFTTVLACLNNTAHGLRGSGPGQAFAGLSDFQTWVCTAAMLLGKLEILVLLVPLTPAFWRE